jgi:hypothetical protein
MGLLNAGLELFSVFHNLLMELFRIFLVLLTKRDPLRIDIGRYVR